MKFKLWSDLHLEGYHFEYERDPQDKDLTLILAGDIGTIRSGLEAFLIEQCDNFKHVIFLYGNHEFYNDNIQEVKSTIKSLAYTLKNLYVLDNDWIDFDGVRIIGTSLYTELTPRNQEIIKNGIMDYRLTAIYDGYEHSEDFGAVRFERMLTPRDTNYMYEQSVLWLKDQLARDYKGETIVVTHWAPTHKLTDPQFFGSPFNPYFCNDLEWLMHNYKIDTWCYGHTHGKIFIDYDEDQRFNGTRLINNPRGYNHELDGFDYNRIFEVK